MLVLKDLGYEFTAFSVGAPSKRVKELIFRQSNLVDFWEVILPLQEVARAVPMIKDIKREVDVPILLSKLDTIEDHLVGKETPFSHFASHGFRLIDRDLLSRVTRVNGWSKAIDGFVFRLTADITPLDGIRLAKHIAADFNVIPAVHVQLPRESEGIAYTRDNEISNLVAETLVAAMAEKDVKVFLDTFVDHDRGYYPRNGLVDRRYNPRSSYYVFLNLLCALRRASEDINECRVVC